MLGTDELQEENHRLREESHRLKLANALLTWKRPRKNKAKPKAINPVKPGRPPSPLKNINLVAYVDSVKAIENLNTDRAAIEFILTNHLKQHSMTKWGAKREVNKIAVQLSRQRQKISNLLIERGYTISKNGRI